MENIQCLNSWNFPRRNTCFNSKLGIIKSNEVHSRFFPEKPLNNSLFQVLKRMFRSDSKGILEIKNFIPNDYVFISNFEKSFFYLSIAVLRPFRKCLGDICYMSFFCMYIGLILHKWMFMIVWLHTLKNFKNPEAATGIVL